MIIDGRALTTPFYINVSHKFNIITGNSADGKTFILNEIAQFLNIKGIPYSFINFMGTKESLMMILRTSNKSLILIDNSELFFDNDVYIEMIKSNCTFIVNLNKVGMLYWIHKVDHAFFKIVKRNNVYTLEEFLQW